MRVLEVEAVLGFVHGDALGQSDLHCCGDEVILVIALYV